MTLDTAQLLSLLAQFPKPSRYWVAFSGGLDSTVLLHALAACRDRLAADVCAVHIDHGLQAQSPAWQTHCQQVCDALQISLTVLCVEVDRQSGKGLEAAARSARYQAFATLLQAGDILCLAQHQDDQAETLLLQLLRGSGAAGLAAMPRYRSFGTGALLRPLLTCSRAELLAYAQQERLTWIEDPSNAHTTLDRNYLRHAVMPLLQERWPAAHKSLARSAQHLAEASQLLLQVAHEDWHTVAGASADRLSLTALAGLTPERQRNVVRYWLQHINHAPLPDTQRLQQIFAEVIASAEDATPCVQWHGVAVRRYRQTLYVTAARLAHAEDRAWDLTAPLRIPELNLRLSVVDVRDPEAEAALDRHLLDGQDLRIGFRQGGERCCPAGRGRQHHDLKKLFQEWGVPPWQRPRVPLLYAGTMIAAVPGYCVCAEFAAAPDSTGIGIKIEDLSAAGIASAGENNDNTED
ncbi:MAG: tRNA lysidine(34) synthetase TilS [Gammaproteobacteria bacterium]